MTEQINLIITWTLDASVLFLGLLKTILGHALSCALRLVTA